MKIHVTKTFTSKVLGLCQAGNSITCDDAIGASIINSKLGIEQPVEQKQKRKSKKINEHIIETGAMNIETS